MASHERTKVIDEQTCHSDRRAARCRDAADGAAALGGEIAGVKGIEMATNRNENGRFAKKPPPVLRTLGERMDDLESSLISKDEAAAIRRDLAKVMLTENEQIGLNNITRDIDDAQRKQISELEKLTHALGKRVDGMDVSDTRIKQLSEQCEATEKVAGLAILTSAVFGIVSIVLACVV